jgi:hypothetical protein
MILGMSLSAFTNFHVVLSLLGIASGFVVLAQMFSSKLHRGCTALFLATTVLTCATGFLFPFERVLPSHIVGVVSLVALAVAITALYGYHLTQSWRSIYAASAVVALYLNVFVLIAQAFLKVSFLHTLAPTGSEPAFIMAQVVVLVAFVWVGFVALKSFHPAAGSARLRPP